MRSLMLSKTPRVILLFVCVCFKDFFSHVKIVWEGSLDHSQPVFTFFFFFYGDNLCTPLLLPLGQDQSTVGQQAETVVDKGSLISCV